MIGRLWEGNGRRLWEAGSVQFDVEVKLFWDDNSYNKGVKRPTLRKHLACGNLNLINFGKNLDWVSCRWIQKLEISETIDGGTSYKRAFKENTVMQSIDRWEIHLMIRGHGLQKEKQGLCKFDLYSPENGDFLLVKWRQLINHWIKKRGKHFLFEWTKQILHSTYNRKEFE